MTSHFVKSTLLGLELLAEIEFTSRDDWFIGDVTLGGNEIDWRDSENVFVTVARGKVVSLGQWLTDLASDKVDYWDDERRSEAAERRGEAA